ncbi:MAG: hypothetical protein RR825_02135, partial [Ruthenibacterium sp.]
MWRYLCGFALIIARFIREVNIISNKNKDFVWYLQLFSVVLCSFSALSLKGTHPPAIHTQKAASLFPFDRKKRRC